ncbi:MAG TPA: hypothetical protein VKM54_15615 [Myxococcota bacterium]|nr:hypothetical protein [Myxococcota bacterium]
MTGAPTVNPFTRGGTGHVRDETSLAVAEEADNDLRQIELVR